MQLISFVFECIDCIECSSEGRVVLYVVARRCHTMTLLLPAVHKTSLHTSIVPLQRSVEEEEEETYFPECHYTISITEH